jgi:hypothetical protein
MDRDLRQSVWLARIMIAANVAVAIVVRDYLACAAGIVWALCCVLWIKILHDQQHTRDEVRLSLAMQFQAMHDHAEGEL